MKIKLLVIIMAVVFMLAGCGSNSGDISPSPTGLEPTNNTNEPITKTKSEYYFENNSVAIYMNDEANPILEALGEPMHYFESPSCAFQGTDRVYTYNGFELYTYTDGEDETEYVFSVVFMNDGVETREGITLSDKLDKVISKYGESYTREGEKYTYTDANCNLSFVLENGEVADVSYNLIID